jgi:hypothetical protein
VVNNLSFLNVYDSFFVESFKNHCVEQIAQKVHKEKYKYVDRDRSANIMEGRLRGRASKQEIETL